MPVSSTMERTVLIDHPLCSRRKRKSSPHTTPFRGIVSSFSQWVYLATRCISASSRIFRRGLGYVKVASFSPLRLGSSVLVQRYGGFGCSGVWLALFRAPAQGDSQANEDRAYV